MNYYEGQAVLATIKFVDGDIPAYPRPYLIVEVGFDYIDVLNISSIKGKERKLLLPTNKEIINYNPPFIKPSFVKLDSLTRVYSNEFYLISHILCNGNKLDSNELNNIKSKIIR